jgi:hypothetical protein
MRHAVIRSSAIVTLAAGCGLLVGGCASPVTSTDTPAVDSSIDATMRDGDPAQPDRAVSDATDGSDGAVAPDAMCGSPVSGDGWVMAPALTGLAPIASEFDPQTTIFASYMPGPNTDDVVGAFRFVCSGGQLLYDDPLVFPGQPGRSHLHQFYGNLSANACSTYETLRTHGASTCGSPGANAANRSAYWVPAMLDGRGNVVQPDTVSIYYKRNPRDSTGCTDGRVVDSCVALPNGLRLIFGFNVQTGDASFPFNFYCEALGGNHASLAEAVAGCPVGSHVIARADAPWCWDGMHLDSPDHRAHVAYAMDTHLGYFACPSTHRYGIPALTLAVAWQIGEGDDPSLWRLSSDHAYPALPAGSTMHADYFEAWDNTVKSMWTDHCIDEHLNCVGGALGNGYSIIGADQPRYLIDGMWTGAWSNPNRLVPVPPMP